MKRSAEPVFWSLFGAGGLLAALVGPGLILATGVLLPLLAPEALSRAQVLAALQPLPLRAALWAVVSLFLWHGNHRLLHSLHDLGWHPGRPGRWLFYGGAALGTGAAAALLFVAWP